jgi:hypothetical protein
MTNYGSECVNVFMSFNPLIAEVFTTNHTLLADLFS